MRLLQELLDIQLDDKDAIRLFSAIADQGFGFTAASHIKDAALLASWQQTAPKLLGQLGIDSMEELLNIAPKTRQQIHDVINKIDPALLSTMYDITPATIPTKRQQKQLTSIVRKHQQTLLTTSFTPEEMAAYLSTGGEGAGAWLHAPAENIKPMSLQHSCQDAFAQSPKQCRNAHVSKTHGKKRLQKHSNATDATRTSVRIWTPTKH